MPVSWVVPFASGRRAPPAVAPVTALRTGRGIFVVRALGISSLAANPIRRRKVRDTARRQVTAEGRFLALSRKEFGVLEVLLRADGAVISTEDRIEQVREENTSYRTNAVRITISNLRSKLGDQALIETLPGEGYRIAADPGQKR